MNIIRRLIQGLKDLVEAEGRELRDQVFRITLALLFVIIGMIMLLAGLLVAATAAHIALRDVVGPAGSLGIIAMFILLSAALLGYIGRQIHQNSQSRHLHLSNKPMPQPAMPPTGGPYPPPAGFNPRHVTAPGAPSASSEPFRDRGFFETETQAAMKQITMAKLEMDRQMEIVKRHPVAAAGAAFALGLVLSRFSTARVLFKTAAIWGGKKLVDRYMQSR